MVPGLKGMLAGSSLFVPGVWSIIDLRNFVGQDCIIYATFLEGLGGDIGQGCCCGFLWQYRIDGMLGGPLQIRHNMRSHRIVARSLSCRMCFISADQPRGPIPGAMQGQPVNPGVMKPCEGDDPSCGERDP